MPAVSTPHTMEVQEERVSLPHTPPPPPPPPPRQIIQLHVEVVKGTVIAVWLILSMLPMVISRFDTNLRSEIARKF